MDSCFVNNASHDTIQGINFFDQVTFADASNGGIATHLAQSLDIVRKQQSNATHARRGQSGLGPRMTPTNNDHIKMFRVLHCLLYRLMHAGH
jgi:hypothetical protein